MLSGGKLTIRGTQASVRPGWLDPRECPARPDRPDLQVVTLGRPDTVVLAVSGELDVASTPILRAHIEFALGGRPARLVLDLAGLRFCDAAGLSALAMARNATSRDGVSLALAAVPRPVTRLLKMTGMNLILDVYPTVSAATMQLPGSG
jgi:anti-sigma B factor antagonist